MNQASMQSRGQSFSPALALRLEAIEAWGISQFTETLVRLKPESGAGTLHLPNGTACFSGIGSPLTCITNVGMNGDVQGSEYDLLERFLLDRGAVPVIKICPLAHPSLFPLLQKRGYVATEFNNTLFRLLNPEDDRSFLPKGITANAADESEAEIWIRTIGQGFRGTDSQTWDEIPQDEISETVFHEDASVCVLARVDGSPAGGGAMSMHNGVAALFAASTLPDYRGRGVHAAVIHKRLAIAQAHGCDVVRYEAALGSGSHRNAERLGFRVAYTRIWMKKSESPDMN